MAMTRALYSINALATELGRDRRTIAKALAAVPPDGKSGKWPAWYMSTATTALKGPKRGGPSYAAMICDRLDGWVKPQLSATECSVDDMARATGNTVDDVVGWLKVGMPFRVEGDWETGEGFVLCFPWAAEWVAMVAALSIHQDDRSSAKMLGL